MARRRIWVALVLSWLMALIAARQGWAACCKCLQCDSAVLCFSGGGDTGDCFETCSGISACPCTDINTCPLQFDALATCGTNGFSDCTEIDNIPVNPTARTAAAPILGSPTSPWFVLVTLALLVSGAVLLTRRVRRQG